MPRKPRAGKSSRLSMDLSELTRTRLELLAARTGAESMAEVVRRALAVYEALCDATAGGGEVVLRAGGRETRLLLV